MIPNKSSKRDSRRSSILKPPKPRQPLQTVKLNTSSNKSSPTTPKLKRRVSFAEKKHVKEFCDSVEQGTVWDSTYEEHDISNVKPSFTNQGQFDAENACKENIQTNKPHNECKDVDCTGTTNDRREDNMELCIPDETFRGIPDQGSCSLEFANLAESVSPAFALQTREEILVQSSPIFWNGAKHNFAASAPKTISIYEDTNKSIPNTITDQFSHHNACNVSNAELNRASCQDLSMVLTSVIATKENQPETEMTLKFQDVSMEFTQAVPVTINVVSSSVEKISNAPSIVENCLRNESDVTHHFINKSLDFTECLESVQAKLTDKLEDVQNMEKYNIDRPQVAKDIIEDTSMEFTVPIYSLIDPVSNMGNPMPVVPTTFVDDDKTKVFQNTSMEITAAVPVVPDIRSMSPCEKAQQFYINFPETGDPTLISKMKNRAMSFEEESMEITKAIEQTTRLIDRDRESEKTQLINVPMEMTKPIGLHMTSSQENMGLNKINCKDLPMFTPVSSEKLDSDIQCLKEIINLDKTKVYIDEPMEFTKAITAFPKICSDDLKLHIGKSENNENISERTKIFHTSMTTTAVVPAFSANNNNKEVTVTSNEYTDQRNTINKTDRTESISERTKIFNTSMTTTAVVPAFCTKDNNKEITITSNEYTDHHNNTNKTYTTENISERTKICNTSMTTTAVVPAFCTKDNNKEITITSNEYTNQHNNTNKTYTTENFSERTKIFNTSMTTTAVVPAFCTKDNNKEITTTCNEYTDHHNNTNKTYTTENISGRTKIFNTSMTTTAVVPAYSTKDKNKEITVTCSEYTDQHNNTNKTVLFPHVSMEVTEVVPGLVLPESFVQKDFSINTRRSTTPSDEAPKHTTVSLPISSAINSHPMLDKENCAAQYSSSNSARSSSVKENPYLRVESSAHFTTSMALHDVEQSICASASNDNNTEKACTLTKSKINPHATSELYQSEHSQVDNLESAVPPKKRIFMDELQTKQHTLDGVSTYTPPELNQNEQLQDHENIKKSMLCTRRTYTKEEIGKHPVPNEAPTLVDPKLNPNKRLQDYENSENGASWRRRTYTKKFKSMDNASEEVTLSGSRVNQNEYLKEQENLETIIPHTRRTFTKEVISIPSTQTSSSNFSVSNNTPLVVSNTENSKVSYLQNDTFYCKTNDKESRAHSTLKYLESSQETANNEECFMDKSITFCCESMEELESIKPPSFLGSDDSNTLESTFPNNIVNQEGNQISDAFPRELNVHCSESFKLRCNNQDNNLLQNERVNLIAENITRNSQTVIDRQKIFDVHPGDPGIACDDEISVIEPQKLQLISMNYSDTEKQVLNSPASSIINTSGGISVFCDISSPKGTNEREVERINTCMGDQSLNCTPLAARNDCGRISVYNADSSPDRNQTMEHIQKDSFNSAKEPCDVYNRVNTSGDRIECSDVQSMQSLESQKDCDEKDSSVEQDPFSSLASKLKIHAQSDDIIWDVCHENNERKMIVVGFIASSLLIVIFFKNDCDIINELIIKDIKIVSRIEDDAGTLAHIVHRIILEKIDTKKLMELYKDREDILTMLDHISKETKLVMDFVFDLKRLSDVNLMEITRDRISFLSHTKRLDIILRVTISVKPFDKIETNDISVECILGSVREEHIKKLIVNIKRDHKFLRRYVSDVRDYIYLMEESSGAIK